MALARPPPRARRADGGHRAVQDYDEMDGGAARACAVNANLVKIVDLGKSHEGRSIWAVEIANAAGTPLDARPALLVAANFEGDQLIGSELALYLARHLATSYAADAQVKKLLDEHAVYILPRVNPDGAEQMFGKVKSSAAPTREARRRQ